MSVRVFQRSTAYFLTRPTRAELLAQDARRWLHRVVAMLRDEYDADMAALNGEES